MKKRAQTKALIRPVLKPYLPLADMLVKTFGHDCEVVVHDLSNPRRSVVYVANNRVTGRKVGQNFDQLVKKVILSDDLEGDLAVNYYFHTEDGRLIRSSSLLIRSQDGRLEGALCINLDTSRLSAQIDYLQSFLPAGPAAQPETEAEERELLEKSGHVAEMVSSLIDSIIGGPAKLDLSREERIDKIRFMENKGIFMMKGSVDQVAEKMGINKVTVYSYLDEVRGKR